MLGNKILIFFSAVLSTIILGILELSTDGLGHNTFQNAIEVGVERHFTSIVEFMATSSDYEKIFRFFTLNYACDIHNQAVSVFSSAYKDMTENIVFFQREGFVFSAVYRIYKIMIEPRYLVQPIITGLVCTAFNVNDHMIEFTLWPNFFYKTLQGLWILSSNYLVVIYIGDIIINSSMEIFYSDFSAVIDRDLPKTASNVQNAVSTVYGQKPVEEIDMVAEEQYLKYMKKLLSVETK